jgi:Polysaccharide deacetylase
VPRARARSVAAFGLILAALLCGGAMLLFWEMLPSTSGLVGTNSAWHSTTAAGTPDLPSVLSPQSIAGTRVAVLDDAENERVTPTGFYEREVAAWRDLLHGEGAVLAPLTDADVVVLPYAVCLGEPVRQLLARQLERGAGLVTVGPVGARDGHCQPEADTVLTSLLGGSGEVRLLPQPDSASDYAVVLGQSALDAGIPPGARIEIRPARQIAFRGSDRSVYYSDYMRVPQSAAMSPYFDGAVVRSRVDAGRVVAFGFALTHVVPGWSRRVSDALATNAVAGAGGRPVVQLATWPNGAKAAVVLAEDVEHEFENGGRVAQLLAKRGVPSTAFLLGNLADENRVTTRKLAEHDEIGTHTVNHAVLQGQSLRHQTQDLQWAQRQLTRLVGHPARGLRPPEEKFDIATLKAWLQAGGDYVFADNNLRAAGPELIPLDGDTLVLLARTGNDDYYMLQTEGIRHRPVLLHHMLDEVRRAKEFRGLEMLSFHSQLLGSPELLGVLGSFADSVAHDPEVWLARAEDVVDWWCARHAVRFSLSPDGRVVDVTNGGRARIQGAVLLADMPDGQRLRYALQPLQPGQSVAVALQVEPPSGSATASNTATQDTRTVARNGRKGRTEGAGQGK